jgi:Protein of unknown function (DUF4236)
VGFYIRKAISVGPFRFNLSKSGIGLSTGIKGFRIGTGPRGNYVQMGRGGIYFRQSLSSPRASGINPSDSPIVPLQSSTIEMQDIESGNVLQMVDSNSSQLLEEINEKAKAIRLWPIALALCIILSVIFVSIDAPWWTWFLIVPVFVAAMAGAVYRDQLRKTVVLFYELESHIEEAYQALHNAFDVLNSCNRIWRVEAKGNVETLYDWKVNAGAGVILKRNSTRFTEKSPPYFKTNVSIPAMPAGNQTLYFFPDRLLVYDSNGVGAVPYDKLKIEFGNSRFIEDGGVPSDSQVVGSTWRYVNKSGGPDKRFSNNRQLPIALYESLFIESNSGLKTVFQLSRTGSSVNLQKAIPGMVNAIAKRYDTDDDETFLKCPCNNCDVLIEFPARGVGQTVICPHCKLETVLFKPSAQ